MNDCILGYDVGSTGIKAAVITVSGRVLASALSPHSTSHLYPGWAEQDPEVWWAGLERATSKITSRLGQRVKSIRAIGVSGHMLGCVAVDRRGMALRPAIIHSDARALSQFHKLERSFGSRVIYRITGNRLSPQSSICKIMWLRDNEPDVYRRTSFFIQSKDYITSRLTGVVGHSDYSDGSHTVMMDIRRRTWSSELLRSARIAAGRLPRLCPSAEIIGTLRGNVARRLGLRSGIPVVAGGGDGACASMGAGAVSVGNAYTYLGGSGWIAHTVERPYLDPKMRVFNILGLAPGTCGVYGTVQCAGSSHQWVKKLLNIASYSKLDRLAASAPVGSNGVLFLPYLMGERSPVWDANARGVYFGLGLAHGRRELARATLEGVAFALRSILEVLAGHAEISEMRLIGGGAASRAWRGILAGVYGRSIMLPMMLAEATAAGAAMAAGVGAGLFSDYQDAVCRISCRGKMEIVRPRHADTERYAELYPLYISLYPALKQSFACLQKLGGIT